MAREFGRWFRFYDGVLDDPKVQRLSDKLFRAWVNLMCLASRRGGRIEADYADVAFSLRVTEGQARETLQALKSAGLMDIEETGIEPHNWSERQFKSDVSTDRVKRFRDRSTKQDETVSETPPDTEQIQNRSEQKTDIVADAPPLDVSRVVLNGNEHPDPEPFPSTEDLQLAIKHWNFQAERFGLPAVQDFTDKRRRSLRLRLAKLKTLDAWIALVDSLEHRPFCLGENKRSWRVDFDYVMREDGFTKLREGGWLTPGKAVELEAAHASG